MFAGTSCYSVELFDTSTERDVLLNQEIVTAGHAQPTLEFHKVWDASGKTGSGTTCGLKHTMAIFIFVADFVSRGFSSK